MKKTRVCLCVCVVVFLLLSSYTNVFAQGGGLSVNNTRIVFEADKIQNTSVPVIVTNNSEDEVVIDIRKADFLIADDGAFIIKDAGTQPYSASSFISCEEKQFNMKPGEKASIDVIFKGGQKYILPEYSSTILVRFITKKAFEEPAAIKTYTQVAVTVRVLAGSLYENNIDLSKAPLINTGVTGMRIISYGASRNLSLALKNTGLLTIEPKVSAIVKSLFSSDAIKLPEMGGYIIPGQNSKYDLSIPTNSILDFKTVEITYTYKYLDKEFEGSCSFSYVVISYPMVIGVLLLLIGFFWQMRIFAMKNQQLKQLLQQQQQVLSAIQAAPAAEPAPAATVQVQEPEPPESSTDSELTEAVSTEALTDSSSEAAPAGTGDVEDAMQPEVAGEGHKPDESASNSPETSESDVNLDEVEPSVTMSTHHTTDGDSASAETGHVCDDGHASGGTSPSDCN